MYEGCIHESSLEMLHLRPWVRELDEDPRYLRMLGLIDVEEGFIHYRYPGIEGFIDHHHHCSWVFISTLSLACMRIRNPLQ